VKVGGFWTGFEERHFWGDICSCPLECTRVTRLVEERRGLVEAATMRPGILVIRPCISKLGLDGSLPSLPLLLLLLPRCESMCVLLDERLGNKELRFLKQGRL
jgi:hypothetical protein